MIDWCFPNCHGQSPSSFIILRRPMNCGGIPPRAMASFSSADWRSWKECSHRSRSDRDRGNLKGIVGRTIHGQRSNNYQKGKWESFWEYHWGLVMPGRIFRNAKKGGTGAWEKDEETEKLVEREKSLSKAEWKSGPKESEKTSGKLKSGNFGGMNCGDGCLEEIKDDGGNAEPTVQRNKIGKGVEFAGGITMQVWWGNGQIIIWGIGPNHASPKLPSGQSGPKREQLNG